MKKVTIIIPVFRNPVGLRACLRALNAQTYPRESIKILVVENSAPPYDLSLREEFPSVCWMAEPAVGSYAARNKALNESDDSIIAFTDSDCLPTPSWIERGVEMLSVDDIAVVGGRVEFVDEQNLNCYGLFEEAMFDDLVKVEKLVNKLGFAITANLFTTKRTFEKAGLFNSALKSSGDREWSIRAVAMGARLIYNHDALVLHTRRLEGHEIRRKLKRLMGGWVSVARKNSVGTGGWRAAWRFMIVNPELFVTSLRCPRKVTPILRIRYCLCVLSLGFYGTFEFVKVFLGGEPSRG